MIVRDLQGTKWSVQYTGRWSVSDRGMHEAAVIMLSCGSVCKTFVPVFTEWFV